MSANDIANGMGEYLQSDGTANYIMMIEGLGVTGKIAGAIIGLLVVIIMIGIPLVVSIEVCYINFPNMQLRIEKLHSRLSGKRRDIVGLVLRDANRALKEAATTSYGESVNYIYLKIKCKSIFISIFIVAMVLGPGQFLIGIALNLVKGLVSAIM